MTAPRTTLETFFFELLDDPSDEGLARLHAAHPDAVEAALAYLRDVHLGATAPSEAWETVTTFSQVMALILTRGGGDAEQRLVALALNVTHLPELRRLADIVVRVVAPDQLAEAMVDALAPGHPASLRATVGALAYHTFDAHGDDYQASPGLQAALAERLSAGDHDAAPPSGHPSSDPSSSRPENDKDPASLRSP